MPRALRARQAFFAELFLAIFAEHVNFALIFSSVAIIILSTVPMFMFGLSQDAVRAPGVLASG